MNRSIKRHAKGFSLTELMVVVAILGIFATMAAPSYQNLIARDRTIAVANDLLSNIQMARSEAVKYNSTALICGRSNGACGSSWSNGWLVRTDQNLDGTPETTIRVRDSIHQNISISSTANSIAFGALGQASTTATITIQHSHPAYTRVICIQSSGRSYIAAASCS